MINIQNYMVIYKGELYKNCLDLGICISHRIDEETKKDKTLLERATVIYIDENNKLKVLEDVAGEFQFIPKDIKIINS